MQIDPREIELDDRQGIESNRLQDEFLAKHPDLDVYEGSVWPYETTMEFNEFMAPARARWAQEADELGKILAAEQAKAS